MGTATLALVNCFLLLQVVSGTPTDEAQLNRGTYNTEYLQGNTNRRNQEITPDFKDVERKPYNYGSFDSKNQNLPSSDKKDKSVEEALKVKVTEQAYPNILGGLFPTDKSALSGAGHLGTNKIMKNPDNKLYKTPVITSKNNIDGSQIELEKEKTPAVTNFYSSPELDKAVENAINNLPSSDDSPIVPLIKAFNKRIDGKSNNEQKDPEELARETFLLKHIVLKLAKRVQNENEERYGRDENLKKQDSQLQFVEQVGRQEGIANDPSVKYESCDNENETSEGLNIPKITSGSNSKAQSDKEDHKKEERYLEHIATFDPKTKEITYLHVPSEILPRPSEEEPKQYYTTREPPSLSDALLKDIESKSTVANTSPSFKINENENANVVEGHVEKGDGNENSQGGGLYYSRFMNAHSTNKHTDETYNQREFSSPSEGRVEYYHTLPGTFLTFQLINEILKKKAAANAFREKQGKQDPRFFPFPSIQKPLNVHPPIISGLVLIRGNDNQPQSPSRIYTPEEQLKYKINAILNSNVHTQFADQSRENSKNEDEPEIRFQLVQNFPKLNHVSVKTSTDTSPQEISRLIKSILANINMVPVDRSFQPTKTQTN